MRGLSRTQERKWVWPSTTQGKKTVAKSVKSSLRDGTKAKPLLVSYFVISSLWGHKLDSIIAPLYLGFLSFHFVQVSDDRAAFRGGPSKIKFGSGAIFLSACQAGDYDEIEAVLRDNDDISINYANSDGLTALHSATIDGNSKMVKYLISKGADINVQGALGFNNSGDYRVFRSWRLVLSARSSILRIRWNCQNPGWKQYRSASGDIWRRASAGRGRRREPENDQVPRRAVRLNRHRRWAEQGRAAHVPRLGAVLSLL